MSVSDVTKDNDFLLKLGRTQMCQSTLSAVSSQAHLYGKQLLNNGQVKKVLNACINVADLAENADWPGFSVSHLRSLLLSEHISALLEAVG